MKRILITAYAEKRYCPICKQKGEEKTTFICQDSGCFCSVCGYKEARGRVEDKSSSSLVRV